MSGRRLVAAVALLSSLTTVAFADDSNFESSKLSPGLVMQGAGLQSPKLSAGVVVERSDMQSSKLSSGFVVENAGFQSSTLSIGIVVEVLSGGGILQRAPLTHW